MDNQTGIVIVSHSDKIANGIKDLLKEVSENIKVEAAGGTAAGGIGTSLDKIAEAIANVSSQKGVVVFYDIGSAKMNAELVIELNQWENVFVIDAPLVEGAYVAAVKTSIGKTADEIKREMEAEFPKCK
ncbi:MAG: PTS-dependent dihydroxyacetone kinase phosphotransferase subunit DhaM [Bacilli bacterium]|mgnify:FL=1|nr:PTS-dependent dihydroxyacetone kinase phosphotransferase subunit DhaM [Bacilli bacterium]